MSGCFEYGHPVLRTDTSTVLQILAFRSLCRPLFQRGGLYPLNRYEAGPEEILEHVTGIRGDAVHQSLQRRQRRVCVFLRLRRNVAAWDSRRRQWSQVSRSTLFGKKNDLRRLIRPLWNVAVSCVAEHVYSDRRC